MSRPRHGSRSDPLVGRDLLKRFTAWGWHSGRVLRNVSKKTGVGRAESAMEQRYLVEWDDGDRQELTQEQVCSSLVALTDDVTALLAAKKEPAVLTAPSTRRAPADSRTRAAGDPACQSKTKQKVKAPHTPGLSFAHSMVPKLCGTLSSNPSLTKDGEPEDSRASSCPVHRPASQLKSSTSRTDEQARLSTSVPVVKPGARRKRRRTGATNESEQSLAGGGTASSSDCGICYRSYTTMDSRARCYSMPCGHSYCAPCIERWFGEAANNTCPVCRRCYAGLRNCTETSACELAKPLVHGPVVEPTESADRVESVESIACQTCRSTEQADVMLLCNECNDAYHIHCLDPKLERVPAGRWFCGRCGVAAAKKHEWLSKARQQRKTKPRRGGGGHGTVKAAFQSGPSTIVWLQMQCEQNGLWAGGHAEEMCDRLARRELGLPSTTLEHAHSVLSLGALVQMLFADGLWYTGRVSSVAAATIAIGFSATEIEVNIPMVVDGAINPELRVVGRLEEAVVDTIARIVDKLEDRAQVEAERQAVADEQAAREDRSTMSYLNGCFASRNSPCGAEQWSQLQQFVSHQRERWPPSSFS